MKMLVLPASKTTEHVLAITTQHAIQHVKHLEHFGHALYISLILATLCSHRYAMHSKVHQACSAVKSGAPHCPGNGRHAQ